MDYSLTTHWHFASGIEPVWEALTKPEEWPRWWRYVEAVVELEKGDSDGLGARRRYTWSSRLPYRLTFEMRTTAVVRPVLLEGVASGDLDGRGRWQLRENAGTTHVEYRWTVSTEKRWMNMLAPILSPVFAWNHHQVMREGGHGLARHLGIALLGFEGSS